MAQGDGAGALTALQSGLKILESMVAHDSGNVEWQLDIVNFCDHLARLKDSLDWETRWKYLQRALGILDTLKPEAQYVQKIRQCRHSVRLGLNALHRERDNAR
jgi:hypothetical protein